MLNITRRRKIPAMASLTLLLVLTVFAQEPAPGSLKLAAIEFEGLQRFSRDQMLKASGLEVGQTVDVAALDAAAQRLLDSGLAKRLSYRLRTNKANQATVTFKIEEGHGGDYAVIFDNFVWFTDEEIADAIRHEIPSFNGTAPNVGNMTDGIARALQHLLSAHKVTGTVEYLPAENRETGKLEHVFVVRGAHLPICTLHFPGTRNVAEERLIKGSQAMMGTEYSRRFAGGFAVSTLFPIYRELGHLRAGFGLPVAKPATTADCKDGVDLTIPVEEGSVYTWDKAEWSGNQTLKAPELDAALGMKSGDVANGLKIDEGIVAARKAYGRKGYIAAFIKPVQVFDDTARNVALQLEVNEGPQYHMGTLTIKGFSDSLGNYLRGKWEMRPGDVYDQAYAQQFFTTTFRDILRKVMEERQAEGKPAPKNIIVEDRPNKDSLTVEVVFELRD
jgi:outer membrane protein assembly factor BamA